MQLQKRKKRKWLTIPLLVLAGVVVVAMVIIFGLFHIREVDVIGNEFYSAEEIEKMVMSDSMAQNSLYLTRKYSNPEAAENLPFLSGVEVSMVNPYHVQIKVYEKTIVGYLMYSGSMVYFDKDGIVVEISQEQREGITPYSGISIGQPVVSEKLPVADEDFFNDIIEGARLIYQSGLTPQEIHYDDKQELILYFDGNRVMLGDTSYLEEKISNLKALFPQMEGLSGTLHMENYTAGTTTISFKVGEEGDEELLMNVNQPEDGGEESTSDGEEGTSDGEEGAEGDNSQDAQDSSENEEQSSSGYVEDPNRITTDADGNQVYTDEQGNVTYNMDMPYLGDDGEIITDGYGYIDPYTGAYILNGQ